MVNALAWAVQYRVSTYIEKRKRLNSYDDKGEMHLWYGWLAGLAIRAVGLVLFIGWLHSGVLNIGLFHDRLIQFSPFYRDSSDPVLNIKNYMMIVYLMVYWIVLSLDLVSVVSRKQKK